MIIDQEGDEGEIRQTGHEDIEVAYLQGSPAGVAPPDRQPQGGRQARTTRGKADAPRGQEEEERHQATAHGQTCFIYRRPVLTAAQREEQFSRPATTIKDGSF